MVSDIRSPHFGFLSSMASAGSYHSARCRRDTSFKLNSCLFPRLICVLADLECLTSSQSNSRHQNGKAREGFLASAGTISA